MATITYNIPAINCGHCVHTIKMELGELKGIKAVEGDPSSKKIIVTYEPPATTQEMEKILKEINFPPVN